MKAPRISEAEWEVMKVIWKKSPRSAQEVIHQISSARTWSPATIKTLLNRLTQKGALTFSKTGKAYHYSPAFSEDEFCQAESDSFLKRVFNGSLSPMLNHFFRTRRLSRQELDSLEKLLQTHRKEK